MLHTLHRHCIRGGGRRHLQHGDRSSRRYASSSLPAAVSPSGVYCAPCAIRSLRYRYMHTRRALRRPGGRRAGARQFATASGPLRHPMAASRVRPYGQRRTPPGWCDRAGRDPGLRPAEAAPQLLQFPVCAMRSVERWLDSRTDHERNAAPFTPQTRVNRRTSAATAMAAE